MRCVAILLIISLITSCGINRQQGETIHRVNPDDSFPDRVILSKLKVTSAIQYHHWLDRLDPVDLGSLESADILFRNCAADTLSRDSMLFIYQEFRNHLAEIYFENNVQANHQLENFPSPETVNSLKAMFAGRGMLLSSSEGSFYLNPQIRYLSQNFGPGISCACREYLAIETREQEALFSREGRILISADSLSSRILKWEEFIQQNPGFISIRLAKEKYAYYLGAFLAGTDNSRAFDQENNHLNDSLKIAFESFAEKNPDSKSTRVVKAYLQMLSLNDFNYSEKVDSFLLDKVYGTEIAGEQKDQPGQSPIQREQSFP